MGSRDLGTTETECTHNCAARKSRAAGTISLAGEETITELELYIFPYDVSQTVLTALESVALFHQMKALSLSTNLNQRKSL